MLSIGLLHSVNKLLDIIQSYPLNADYLKQSKTFFISSVEDIVELSLKAGWIKYKEEGYFSISDRGKDILNSYDYEERLKKLLKDLIIIIEPAWSKKISHGRKEFQRYAPKEIFQCFVEAGLYNTELNDELIKWWDELSIISRNIRNAEALITGRLGEKLTLKYETLRTGYNPKWQALESNYSGYDILSRNSQSDDTPMQIEVKATRLKMKEAKIFITINEWKNANIAISFKFYLWIICNSPLLAILDVNDIFDNIPQNAGEGQWETVSIPMLTFREKFIQHTFPDQKKVNQT